MRSLIKPGLRAIARTGLFLSVTTWVVGYCWCVTGAWTILEWSPQVIICDAGVLVSDGAFPLKPWTCSFKSAEWTEDTRLYFEAHGDGSTGYRTGKPVIGFVKLRRIVGYRHWVAVAFFTLFLVAIEWVYRKRGKGGAR